MVVTEREEEYENRKKYVGFKIGEEFDFEKFRRESKVTKEATKVYRCCLMTLVAFKKLTGNLPHPSIVVTSRGLLFDLLMTNRSTNVVLSKYEYDDKQYIVADKDLKYYKMRVKGIGFMFEYCVTKQQPPKTIEEFKDTYFNYEMVSLLKFKGGKYLISTQIDAFMKGEFVDDPVELKLRSNNKYDKKGLFQAFTISGRLLCGVEDGPKRYLVEKTVPNRFSVKSFERIAELEKKIAEFRSNEDKELKFGL